MKHIEFKQQNKILLKPSSMTDEECSSLHVFTDGEQCISLWKGSFWERVKFLFIGKMWFLIVSGQTQPPIKLQLNPPFKKQQGAK